MIGCTKMVIDELEWEPRIDTAHIGVACRDGVITLSGYVTGHAERMLGLRAVSRRRRSNSKCGSPLAGRRRTTKSPDAPSRSFNGTASCSTTESRSRSRRGIVTLAGPVDWQYQKDEAEFDIRKLGGVSMIINDIIVKPQIRTADVQAGICKALERNADLDFRITVTAQGDKVILGGKVGSWIEREVAERAAWSAPRVAAMAVAAIEDHIAIARR